MLKASYLNQVSDRIDILFANLQTDIEKDIARRIAKTNLKASSATIWQKERLKEVNALYKQIQKNINKTLKEASPEVLNAFSDSVQKSVAYDNKIFKKDNFQVVSNTSAFEAVMDAGYQQTMGTLINLCNSSGSVAMGKFSEYIDAAYLQVTSGAFSPERAISNAVSSLAKDGIYMIDYKNGRSISIEAGVRRAVVTGVNRTTSIISLNRSRELGFDLVKTTEHMGARPEHAAWQGKVFSLSGSGKYPNFYEVTGYGAVDGLCGANCRHSFYPYSEEFDSSNSPEIGDDKENSGMYALNQEQRYNERMIRHWKRRADTMEAGGQTNSYELNKIREWQKRQREFVEENGLTRQYAREKVYN